MEPQKGLSKLSFILLSAFVGILAGLGIYRASQQGLLPINQGNLLPNSSQQDKSITVLKEENAVINVVDKTSNSVVAIGSSRRVVNPFDPFSSPQSESSTIGTGFIVSDKGIIVTNKHVVSDTDTTYKVVTKDGKDLTVSKIYRDPVLDLAVLQVENNSLAALNFGDSSKLKVGQTVVAIGNALGQFTNTVTTGVVSGLGRRVVAGDPFSGSFESLDDLIQTDAAINPGNSGGPLLNLAGEVIGVNVATTEGAQNIGFAIPANSVKKIVDEFVTTGTVSRPFLGIRYRFISKDVAILNEVPQGAYIQEVVAGSAAEKAGIEVGDIVIKIDGKTVSEENSVSEAIASKKIGDNLSLTVWRDGQEIQATATLQDLPNE